MYIVPTVETTQYSLCSFWVVLSPLALGGFLTCVSTPLSTPGAPSTHLQHSPVWLSSNTLPCKLQLPWLSWPPSSILNLERLPGSLKVPLSAPQPGNSLQAVNWGSHGVHLTWFLALKDHCLSCPDVPCRESHWLIYIYCPMFCFRKEGNSDPCYCLDPFFSFWFCNFWISKKNIYCVFVIRNRNP